MEAGSRPTPTRRNFISKKTAIGMLLLAGALWLLVFVWQSHTGEVHRRIDAGMEFARLGEGRKAEQEWLTALKLAPDNAAALELLGGYYLSTNNPTAALDPYRHLLRVNPRTPGLYAQLALCAYRTGDEVSALRYAQEALKQDPNNIPALTVSVQLLAGMGDDKKRLEQMRLLVKLQPDNIQSLTQLATALIENQNYAESKPILDHILQRDPQNSQAYALRGEAAFDEGAGEAGMERAAADFTHALQSNPTNAFARMYLGKTYGQLHQTSKSIFQLEEAARLAPNKPEVYFELAAVYSQAGNATKAGAARQRFLTLRRQADLQSSLEKRCAVAPDNFQDHLDLGLLTLRAGDYRKASFYLNIAHKLRPQDTAANAALQQLDTLTGASRKQ